MNDGYLAQKLFFDLLRHNQATTTAPATLVLKRTTPACQSTLGLDMAPHQCSLTMNCRSFGEELDTTYIGIRRIMTNFQRLRLWILI